VRLLRQDLPPLSERGNHHNPQPAHDHLGDFDVRTWLSYSAASHPLGALEVSVDRTTVWRDLDKREDVQTEPTGMKVPRTRCR
jgi:hypothetical protein